ncbi:undecaprenyl-phosphate glucose phosphotransferase [Neptuniibacter sp. 1_MG-2023]|jgi:putative colanic acid biosynthesis UDP-glucose lipid carrier transferase|uniref:undecaprenyl-phosphate glucose phosphotransferase n=1 Tax=Neptuniibacter sp. 1_MG-2023 TaxID=3062662 RepID=UPI0026E48C48|nr:undecaprenyl-phosphate glucose phosphotransferase [Neptuniibacter sp. 1_MG-2023]MDO6592913.1 undecaprenyl-phosphate glucose phosphotransferase [Neptuniibacter sp. 1_MG-2023]
MTVNNLNTGTQTAIRRNKRLLKNHESLTSLFQLAADVFVAATFLFLLTWVKLESFPPAYRVLTVIAAFSLWFIYSSRGVYRQSSSCLRGCIRLSGAWGILMLLLLLIGFVTKTSEVFSREILLIWAFAVLVFQNISFCLVSYLSKKYKEGIGHHLPVMIIGTGSVAQHLVESLNKNRWLPDKVIGCVKSLDKDQTTTVGNVNVLGGLENIRELIKEHDVRRIYIALPMKASEQIEGVNIDLLDENVDVIWAPDIFALNLLNHSVREVAGVPLISLNESPLTSSKASMVLKDVMDRTIAAVALCMLAPLMVWVAYKVKRSSPGPVFFKQDRHGWDGKVIQVWKFRSMKLHDEANGEVQQATKEDPRITDIGRFIRRTSIDELPQLINVLQGSMSLVGPRPHAVAHNNYYSDKINAYLARHRIKPGMTGLAQINGYRGETETIDKMERRVEYDLSYINNWSLFLDVKILIKTPISLFSKEIY